METRREGVKIRCEHIAGLGSVAEPMTVSDRVAFWSALHQRLAKLGNRIGDEYGKLLGAVHARIPMVTIDEQRTLQRENAEADETFWTNHQDMQAATAEDQRGLAAAASHAAAGLEEGAAEAAKNAATAKERIARLAKGEDVSGGLGKPFTREDFDKALLSAGFTKSDLRRCQNVATIAELGAYEELIQETHKATDRARRATVRKVLEKAVVQALRDGRLRP